jgi:hypothetical protein
MALEVTIGGNGTLFVGEDKIIRFECLVPEFDSAGKPIAPSATTPVQDMTGWTLLFDVRKKDNAAAPAIFGKTPTLIGVFNIVRAVNTQRGIVVLTDTELNTVKQATYRHSWKRMDDNSETVLAWGDFAPQKATAP